MNLFSMQRSSSEMSKKSTTNFGNGKKRQEGFPWKSHGNPWPFQKDFEDFCQLLSSHLMSLTCYKGSHMRHDARNFNQGTKLDERIRKDMKGDGELLISLIANITVGIYKSDLNLVLQKILPWKLTSIPLKIDGWKMYLPIEIQSLFREHSFIFWGVMFLLFVACRCDDFNVGFGCVCKPLIGVGWHPLSCRDIKKGPQCCMGQERAEQLREILQSRKSQQLHLNCFKKNGKAFGYLPWLFLSGWNMTYPYLPSLIGPIIAAGLSNGNIKLLLLKLKHLFKLTQSKRL